MAGAKRRRAGGLRTGWNGNDRLMGKWRWWYGCWLGLALAVGLGAGMVLAESPPPLIPQLIAPGDTWPALARRYGVAAANLQAWNGVINPGREPIMGATVQVPAAGETTGRWIRPIRPSPLLMALRYGVSPGRVRLGVDSAETPYHSLRPIPGQAFYLPGGDAPPRDLPTAFTTLELSRAPLQPGRAFAFRAELNASAIVTATLEAPLWDALPFNVFQEGTHLIGLRGVGAFYPLGPHDLRIQADGQLWSQPWLMTAGQWEYQSFTYSGAAAQIDAESMRLERERLLQIWGQANPQPGWGQEFARPITDFLYISSLYGTRRSTDGGATYPTYHEGVDFAAPAGAPVYAGGARPGGGARNPYVRGGAVILDHGLGVYTGYYHLSEILVSAGQPVQMGDRLGSVGTTGRSTGNHLHWDMLVAASWVDADAWIADGMGCWLLMGLGQPCNG